MAYLNRPHLVSRRIMWSFRLVLIYSLLLCAFAQADNWYVSKSINSSGDGKSWGTAWKDSTNIIWGSIGAGDTIYFDGGSSGLSYSKFNTITANGTSSSYITIARSLEPGRNGIVTFATPCEITGNYIKFDGGGYVQVSPGVYRTGIVFTCNSSIGSFTGGQSVNVTGQKPWMRYVYFNGNFGAGKGNSFGVRNNTGFVLDHCWFYQSSWEDQVSWSPSGTGASVEVRNCVFQDNVQVGASNPPHRDIVNTWTGSGGYSLRIEGNIVFNSAGRSPQGDGFLLQDAYKDGQTCNTSVAPLTNVVVVNNVCYNYARLIAFGSCNSGHNGWKHYNNTIYQTTYNGGYSSQSPASGPSVANTLNSGISNWINPASPLGADGIPFTADDGFNLVAGSNAINAGSLQPEVSTDIRGVARDGRPDLGAYEYAMSNGVAPNPPSNLTVN